MLLISNSLSCVGILLINVFGLDCLIVVSKICMVMDVLRVRKG